MVRPLLAQELGGAVIAHRLCTCACSLDHSTTIGSAYEASTYRSSRARWSLASRPAIPHHTTHRKNSNPLKVSLESTVHLDGTFLGCVVCAASCYVGARSRASAVASDAARID